MSAPGQEERTGAVAVIVYTLLRLALFAAVWLVLEFGTPLPTAWALIAALLISGAISLVVLDRQRGAAGAVAGRFFGRLNARIEASARAEDESMHARPSQSEHEADRQPVQEQQEPGVLKRPDEPRTESS